MPKFSIITINLNNAVGLKKTIHSVISQKFNSFEYIIIDGGSQDDSIDIIRENEKNITYWISEVDSGIYNAMNKGILKAEGEYLFFLNSGDCFLENILTKLDNYNFTEDVFYGNIVLKNNEKVVGISKGAARSKLTFYDFFAGESIRHQAALIKRELFGKFGGYAEEYKIVSDWYFFIIVVILKGGEVRYEDIDIAFFETGGLSSKWDELHLKERQKVFENVLPQGIYLDYIEMEALKQKLQELECELNRFRYRFQHIDAFISSCKEVILRIKAKYF